MLFLEFRNGYRVQITFSYDSGTFLGVQCLYDDFNLEGGELFLFQYNGVDGFNVYLIGTDFSEIDYPAIVHGSQNSRPRKGTLPIIRVSLFQCEKTTTDYIFLVLILNKCLVSLQKGGLHGIRFLTEGNPVHDELVSTNDYLNILVLVIMRFCK